MRVAIIPAIAACCTAALVATAAPTHADDQSFLNYLQGHGQPTTSGVMGPAQFVISGHEICTNIHAGADPLVGFSIVDRAMMGPTIVEAAQHELCPDTLH